MSYLNLLSKPSIEDDADGYKVSHWQMVKPTTTFMQYHYIPRGGRYREGVFFGLTPLLETLEGEQVTRKTIRTHHNMLSKYLGISDVLKWRHVLKEHDGKLQVRINALPEGTVAPVGIPWFTVENTCPDCAFLPGYLETRLERVWYPSAVATRVHTLYKQMYQAFMDTGAPMTSLPYSIHDFAGRSYSSKEAAMLGGAAHLTHFRGTDTMIALRMIKEVYNESSAGESVAASEHSVSTTFGPDGEEEYIDHMLTTFPQGILSIVADTYDYYNFVDILCKYKERILSRPTTPWSPVVIRPDSGDPRVILPWTLQRLWNTFGGTVRKHDGKEYKVLDQHVRVINGDGNKEDTLFDYLKTTMDHGFCPSNLVWGIGTGLAVDGLTRDTMEVAYKANHAIINGVETPIFKSPITSHKKHSIAGRFKVVSDNGNFKLVPWSDPRENELRTVFENGNIVNRPTWSDVVKRATSL